MLADRRWIRLLSVNRPKTVDCVFLGYVIHSVGYRFLIINSKVPDMVEGTIMESRDAAFFKDEFPMKSIPSTR
jgi:hypothetical protein